MEHIDALHVSTAIDGLTMGVQRVNPPIGLLDHSHRGVQCAFHTCRRLLGEHGMAQSMSLAGNCYNNRMMEGLWATLKREPACD